MEYDISNVADGQSTVYLRWTMGDTDSGWRYSGWNIDDVEVWGLESQESALFTDGFESDDTIKWTDGSQ